MLQPSVLNAPLVDIPAPQDYPIEALPEVMRDAVKEAQVSIQAPLPLMATSALAAFSYAVQAHYDVRRGEGLVAPTSLFAMAIAESGERKSSCDKYFCEPVQAVLETKRAEALVDISLFRSQHDAWAAERKGHLKRIEATSAKAKSQIGDIRAVPLSPMRPEACSEAML